MDAMLRDEVRWMPYTQDLVQNLNDQCFSGQASWRAEVPMICFDTVEWHYPSRVKRQFGLMQEIPQPLDLAHDSLHEKQSARTWNNLLADLMEMWDDRADRRVEGQHAEPNDLDLHIAYMNDYWEITRRFINPPLPIGARSETGYRPYAGEHHSQLNLVKHVALSAKDGIKSKSKRFMLKTLRAIFTSCKSEIDTVDGHCPFSTPEVSNETLTADSVSDDDDGDDDGGEDDIPISQMTQVGGSQRGSGRRGRSQGEGHSQGGPSTGGGRTQGRARSQGKRQTRPPDKYTPASRRKRQ